MTVMPSLARGRASTGTWSFLAGYAGIAGFFALEALTRQRGTASSLSASPDDQGTTRMIITAYALAADLPLVLRRLPIPQLPWMAGPAGVIVQAGGLALRAWAMRTLGASYTRTLRTADEQRVVEAWPYRLVRHPGYSGSLLTWTGFALASRSVPVIVLVTGLLGWTYQRRISKLIPFIW